MQKSIVYSWTVNIPTQLGTIVNTNGVPAKVMENCSIHVTARVTSRTTVSLDLHKTNLSPFRVDINLRLCNIKEEQKLNYQWTNSCGFSYTWPTSVAPTEGYRLIHIICVINWTVPEAIPPPPPFYFSCEMQRFLMNPSFSDVKIIIGREELPAHKLILVGNSPVFLTMLSAPMTEAQTNRIVINDIALDTMKTILTFLYTGKYEELKRDVIVALEVLAAAQKYDIKSLKDACEYNLFIQLDVENVLKILEDAELYEAERLKKECWKFIIENKREIISTVRFHELCLRNNQLMNQFMDEIIRAYP